MNIRDEIVFRQRNELSMTPVFRMAGDGSADSAAKSDACAQVISSNSTRRVHDLWIAERSETRRRKAGPNSKQANPTCPLPQPSYAQRWTAINSGPAFPVIFGLKNEKNKD